jgi:hypothetical protein
MLWKPKLAGVFCSTVLSLLAADTLPVRGDTLFADNFESYAVGSDIYGQGGWTGGYYNGSGLTTPPDPTLIASGGPFSSQFLNGNLAITGQQTFLNHALSHALDSNEVTTHTFDAYAWNVANDESHNSILGLGQYGATGWECEREGPEWIFDAHGITGKNSDLIYVPGGYNTLVHFSIVVDGLNDTVYGTYDYGNGVQTTPAFSVTPAQIAAIDQISISMDYRSGPGLTGAAYDNIDVSAATSAVPEPNALVMLGGMLASGGLLLFRRHRSDAVHARNE